MRPSVVGRTDIGNAEITHTIFGRAKVRIIRKQDEIRRAWLLAALAATVTVAAAWLGWVALQKYESMQNAIPPANLPSVSIKPTTPALPENNNPATSQKGVPQPPLGFKPSGQIAAKPIGPQPLTANRQQTAPLAIDNNSTKPAAKKPVPVFPLAEPLIKEDAAIPLPAGDNQSPVPVDAQP